MTGEAPPTPNDRDGHLAPPLRRRMACLLYEVLVLFGVALLAGALGAALFAITKARHDWLLQSIGFAIFGLYFVWYWSRTGQTLPMQTWRIRLQTQAGRPLSIRQAVLRYVCASVWVLPGAAFAHILGLQPRFALATVGAWILTYALSSRWHPRRQFWHDAICRTELVPVESVPRRPF